MQPLSQISQIWQKPDAPSAYTTGVSLHSHTSLSLETLSFIHAMCTQVPLVGAVVAYYGRISREKHNLTLDFESAHWRPPLVPIMAFKLERRQILSLGLEALVSITDHDDIQAPLLLRTVPVARRIPVSVEWTAPFGATAFHLGIHNLPSAEATGWMRRFEAFTAAPNEEELHRMLYELHSIPQVLTVLNHPIWDLYKIGVRNHAGELGRFLSRNNDLIHALELNGLRHARENMEVRDLAGRWSQLLISGGDRHGLEPNANINLTNTTSFSEFVHEIRVERRSHVLFLEQYARPWEQRILESTLDAISDHPQFSPGWQRWDERAFHRDASGEMRTLAELWTKGKAPLAMRLLIHGVRLFRYRTLARALSLAFPRVNVNVLDSEAVQETA
jgi:hypothetical protein